MNLALIFRYVHALIVSIANNSALSFVESVEGVSHDHFTRSLHKSGHWLRVLVSFVSRSALAGGYLILDDTFPGRKSCLFVCSTVLADFRPGT
jgi:hypothetical protein